MNNIELNESIKNNFAAWWKGEDIGRPLYIIRAPKVAGEAIYEGDRWAESSSGETSAADINSDENTDYKPYWTDAISVCAREQKSFENAYFTAETFPRLFANLGVTSLALFLGCEPIFGKDTIWYKHPFKEINGQSFQLKKNNIWLKQSLAFTKKAKEVSLGTFKVGIPDIGEHLDVLASLFDTEQLLYHIADYPDEVFHLSQQVQEAWKRVYQLHHDIVTEPDGTCYYGPFGLVGKGRVAKLQCDMSAMLSCNDFNSLVLPFLRQQTSWLDNSVYHLDGKDAIRHLDAVLSLEKLSALQWTPGAGQPDGGDEHWDFIYEKALLAGKSIYALVHPSNIKRFVKRFGTKGILIVTNAKDKAMAQEIAH